MTVAIGCGIHTEYKTSSALGFWFTQRRENRKEKKNQNKSIRFLFRYSQGATWVLVISDKLQLNSDSYLLFNLDIIWGIAHVSGYLGWMDHWKVQVRVTSKGSSQSNGTWWSTEACKNSRKHSRKFWATFPSHIRHHSLNQTFPQTVKAGFPFSSFLASVTIRVITLGYFWFRF